MVAYTSLVLLGAAAATANPMFPRGNQARQNQVVTVTVPAPPAPVSTAWNAGMVSEYPIHASCNATQRAYLKKGLQETVVLCKQARDHILRWGNSSSVYKKYFGNAPTGEPIGWFSKIVDGDKSNILFRCDNPDGNCAIQGYAGHWRGSNATSETVICDRSYELRRPLEGMCMHGYNVANGATNFYWASDLLHRLLHIPKVGEGVVEHYSTGKYPGVISLAKTNSTWSVRDSDTLQYFALEVYAHDIAIPGVGCPGTYTATSSAPAAAATSSRAASSMVASVTPSPVAAVSSAAAAVSSAAAVVSSRASAAPAAASSRPATACTPHDDHWHCPPGVPQPSAPPA